MTVRKNWRNLASQGFWIRKFDPVTHDVETQWYEFGHLTTRLMIFSKDDVNSILTLFHEFKEAEKI